MFVYFALTSLARVENCSCSASSSSRRSKIASESSPNKIKPSRASAIFESVFGIRNTYRHPVGLPLLRKPAIKKIVQVHYPRVSPSAHPLTQQPEVYQLCRRATGRQTRPKEKCCYGNLRKNNLRTP